jgi:hypothetical protein
MDPPRDQTADSSRCSTSPSNYRLAPAGRVPVVSGATLAVVSHSVLSTTPTAEKPALSDEERAERRRRLAERVFRFRARVAGPHGLMKIPQFAGIGGYFPVSPNGLDRDTLEHIEQLTNSES